MAESGLITAAAPADRDAFLAELEAATDRAGAAAGGFDRRDFLVAGRRISLRFAGPPLVAPLTAALGHAEIEPGGPADLTVSAWDSASTGVRMPTPPWSHDDYREHGVIRGWFDEQLQIVFQWITNSVSVLEPRRRRATFWVADPAGFPYFDRAAPLRKLLHLWLASEGLQLVHAAALRGGSGCVILVGNAGAGKSSAALACLGDPDLAHIADDYCVLEPAADGGPPMVHAIYSSAKAHPDSIERLGLDPAMVANPIREEGDKAVLFLHDHVPDLLADRAPLRAIAVPVISGRRGTRLLPVGGGQALAALAPSTMLQLPGTGAATMGSLAAAVRSVPCFRLEVGTDPAEVPAVIAELLAQ